MEKFQKRKKYTIEFKKNSIRLIDEKGLSFVEAGFLLNTSPKNLQRWHQLYNGKKDNAKLKNEINCLKKKVIQLNNEKDFLLKIVIFLSRNINENSIKIFND